MLSLLGDTAGLVSHLEKILGDYRGTEQALFRLDRGNGGGGERRREEMREAESDGCNRVDGEIAERMVVRVKGWMRRHRRIATEIWGKLRVGKLVG